MDAFPPPYTLDDAKAFLSRAMNQSLRTYFAIATNDKAIDSIGLMTGQGNHDRSCKSRKPVWL